jgi:predicted PolB exonuclease-like 3'-5' exonuclease
MLDGYGTIPLSPEQPVMVNSISADIIARRQQARADSNTPATAFLIVDTESVPDGDLLARVKYPGENLTPEQAIDRAQAEARGLSQTGSDFLPVTFQIPVAISVVRVAADFSLQAIACLDTPDFRPREMVRKFWMGVARYKARLVTFNGRGFDLPLLELAAFRWGYSVRDHFYNSRNRFNGNHIDLFDWLSNYGACRISGGLNLLAKLLGKPGKMGVDGAQVYAFYQEKRLQEINDYCLCDTLDTYFVFLRTRVLLGDLTLSDESTLVRRAQVWLTAKIPEFPILRAYLQRFEEPSNAPELPQSSPEEMSHGASD